MDFDLRGQETMMKLRWDPERKEGEWESELVAAPFSSHQRVRVHNATYES